LYNLFSFYRSKEWEALRTRLMLEPVDSNGDVICEHCGKPITVAYDCIAHHVTELTEANGSIGYVWSMRPGVLYFIK